MKVFDIISEAPKRRPKQPRPSMPTPTLGPDGRWGYEIDGKRFGAWRDQESAIDWGKKNPDKLKPGATRPPSPAPKTPVEAPKVPAETPKPPVEAPKPPSAAPEVPKDSDVPGTGTPKKTVSSKGKDRSIREIVASAKRRLARKGLKAAKYEAIYDRVYGLPFRILFKIAGLTAAIYNTWAVLDSLEEEYLEDEIKSLAALEEAREFVWGEFLLVTLTPAVARWVVNTRFVLAFTRIIKNTAAVISAPVTAGASVLAAVSTEALIAFFQWWLTTEAGRDFLSKYAYDIIRYPGKPVDWAQDKIMAAFNEYQAKFGLGTDDGGKYDRLEKEKEKRANMNAASSDTGSGDSAATAEVPAGKSVRKVPRGEKPVVSSKEKWPEEVRRVSQNRIIVGGRVVTEYDGYLLPRIDRMPDVRLAREEAKRLGLPDPLADIPVRSGDTPPEPL